MDKHPQDRGSIAQHIQAAQGGDVAERLAGRARILPSGSSRVVTTAVPHDSTPSLPVWHRLTRWSVLQFAVWPQCEVRLHEAKCDSGSDVCPQYRPMSIITFEAPSSLSAEHQEVMLPSPQHSRAPLGSPHFVSLLSSKEILVVCIRYES